MIKYTIGQNIKNKSGEKRTVLTIRKGFIEWRSKKGEGVCNLESFAKWRAK